jgi:hypothetical protein
MPLGDRTRAWKRTSLTLSQPFILLSESLFSPSKLPDPYVLIFLFVILKYEEESRL